MFERNDLWGSLIMSSCRVRFFSVCLVVAGVLCATLASDHALAQEAAGRIEIIQAEWIPSHQYHPGGVRLWIRNGTGKELAEPHCRVWDGKRAGEDGGMISLFYVKLSPPILKAGEEGEIEVQFEKPTTLPKVLVELAGGTEPATKFEVALVKPPVKIDAVCVGPYLRKAYVYVKNESKNAVHATAVGFGPRKERAFKEPVKIAPGAIEVLAARISTDTEKGEFADVRVTLAPAKDGGVTTLLRRMVRVTNGFPIMAAGGSGPKALGLDTVGFYNSVKACPSDQHRSGLKEIRGADFMQSPGPWQGSGRSVPRKFLKLRRDLFALAPHSPTHMWIARWEAPQSYFEFGGLTDVAVVVPNVTYMPMRSGPRYREVPNQFLASAESARQATDLTHYIAGIDTHTSWPGFHDSFEHAGPSPDELRFTVWNAISTGARGLILRGTRRKSPDIFRLTVLKETLDEIRPIRSFLSIAHTVHMVSVDGDSPYDARTVQCGDRMMVVALLDRRVLSLGRGQKFRTPALDRTERSVELTVRIPSRSGVASVEPVGAPLDDVSWQFRDGVLRMKTTPVRSAEAWTIFLNRRPEEAAEAPVSPPEEDAGRLADLARQHPDSIGIKEMARRARVARRLAVLCREQIDRVADALPSGKEVAPVSAEYFYQRYHSEMSVPIKLEGLPEDLARQAREAYTAQLDAVVAETARHAQRKRAAEPATIEIPVFGVLLPALFDQARSEGTPSIIPAGLEKKTASALEYYCASRFRSPRWAWNVAQAYANPEKAMSELEYYEQLADKCVENREIEGALACRDVLEELVQDDEEELVELRRARVRCLHKCYDYDAALATAKSALKKYPDSIHYGQLVWSQITVLLSMREHERALSVSEDALKDERLAAYEAYFLIGKWNALCQLKKGAPAKQVADKLLKEHRESKLIAPILLWTGFAHLPNAQYKEAHAIFTELLTRFPDSPEAVKAKDITAKLKNVLARLERR